MSNPRHTVMGPGPVVLTPVIPPSIGITAASGPPAAVGAPELAAGPTVSLLRHALPPSPLDPRLVLVTHPDSERAAAYRVLRHHLLDARGQDPRRSGAGAPSVMVARGAPQVIVVSSARAGDGKTTTAVNLALALAECGRARVLLVEAHLRRPQLADVFRFEPPTCFATQITTHRITPHEPWTFVELPQQWLHVGAVDPALDRTQLLDGPAFSIAMEQLRQAGYDHIVVDGPSVLGSADVNLMADAADAILLAVKAERTTTRDLRRAIDQVGTAKLAGTVLVEG